MVGSGGEFDEFEAEFDKDIKSGEGYVGEGGVGITS